MAIGGSTPVAITVGQIIGGIAAAVVVGGGVLWAVLSFAIGNIREDVSAIRGSVSGLQVADKTTLQRNYETELKLTGQIDVLKTELTGFSGKLDIVNVSIQSLSTQMGNLTSQMANFQKVLFSQQNFISDPKNLEAFSEALKKSGIDQGKIVIVPFVGFSPPR